MDTINFASTFLIHNILWIDRRPHISSRPGLTGLGLEKTISFTIAQSVFEGEINQQIDDNLFNFKVTEEEYAMLLSVALTDISKRPDLGAFAREVINVLTSNYPHASDLHDYLHHCFEQVLEMVRLEHRNSGGATPFDENKDHMGEQINVPLFHIHYLLTPSRH